MRAIVFLLFVILAFLIVRFTLNRIIEIRKKQRDFQRSQETPESQESQAMVRCAECGVHLPQSEAFYDGKDTFCSEGHMQAYHQKKRESDASSD